MWRADRRFTNSQVHFIFHRFFALLFMDTFFGGFVNLHCGPSVFDCWKNTETVSVDGLLRMLWTDHRRRINTVGHWRWVFLYFLYVYRILHIFAIFRIFLDLNISLWLLWIAVGIYWFRSTSVKSYWLFLDLFIIFYAFWLDNKSFIGF